MDTSIGEVTIDSGAEESVCPLWWGEEFEISGPAENINLINASGEAIVHYGTRRVEMDAKVF